MSEVYDKFDCAYGIGYADGHDGCNKRESIANDPEIGINYQDGFEDGSLRRESDAEDGY